MKEEQLTRSRDALAAECRRMPRMRLRKEHRFEGPDGPAGSYDAGAGRLPMLLGRLESERSYGS